MYDREKEEGKRSKALYPDTNGSTKAAVQPSLISNNK